MKLFLLLSLSNVRKKRFPLSVPTKAIKAKIYQYRTVLYGKIVPNTPEYDGILVTFKFLMGWDLTSGNCLSAGSSHVTEKSSPAAMRSPGC